MGCGCHFIEFSENEKLQHTLCSTSIRTPIVLRYESPDTGGIQCEIQKTTIFI